MEAAEKQERLKDEILADAEKRAANIVKRAERDAQKIDREAKDNADGLIEEALGKASADAEREAHRAVAAVPLEMKRRDLTAREAAIAGAIAAAREHLADLDGAARTDLTAALLAQAAAVIGEAHVLVQCSERDRPALGEVLDKAQAMLEREGLEVRLDAASDAAGLSLGVIVLTPDGHKLVDNSLEGRCDRLAPQMRLQLANLLFGEQTDAGND